MLYSMTGFGNGIFNFNDKKWNKISVEGVVPCARDGHLCSVIDNNYMMIYSGLNSLDEVISSTNLLDLSFYIKL